MAKIAKKKAAARAAFEGKSNLAVEDAVALVKANATARFDETVEIAMNLGVDPRHADQMVRGVVQLPNGTGKDVRVAVFARGPAFPNPWRGCACRPASGPRPSSAGTTRAGSSFRR